MIMWVGTATALYAALCAAGAARHQEGPGLLAPYPSSATWCGPSAWVRSEAGRERRRRHLCRLRGRGGHVSSNHPCASSRHCFSSGSPVAVIHGCAGGAGHFSRWAGLAGKHAPRRSMTFTVGVRRHHPAALPGRVFFSKDAIFLPRLHQQPPGLSRASRSRRL